MTAIEVPEALAATQIQYEGEAGRAFIDSLPGLAADMLTRWGLTVDGPSMHGMAALVLPVRRADGTPAALKLQALNEESAGEADALRAWADLGAVRVLDHAPENGSLLLERLDSARSLDDEPDVRQSVLVIAGMLARFTAVPAPSGMRRLGDIAAGMVAETPDALRAVADPADRRLVADCAAAVREVMAEPGDSLLHWDLHFENVLAGRGGWVAIDPKPLAGDPGFDLWPALNNRFDPADVRWRFDAMTEVMGLDRERAKAWTLGRILQNALWAVEDEEELDEDDLMAARLLLGGRSGR
ncbi:aminoglycoside phosphotransferase family protein [Streptomyces sp. NPDC048442]|uniref:aminoglycoside phosphotransferase family protein n=1 Tax=Streptomyces sp. NPDC048442 TaxID=3154823 RepID=UPI00343A89BB